ncbi:MAG: amidinotransferase [Gammaproteobacteria bacterium]|jgi:dimethylargininase|nr:amidinotransferase [Gammaproteobacteria bacterium]NCF83355.1 amidinotransferase [Pseudomonadota bacterium]
MTFTHAIARRPAMNAGDGLTSASFGAPDPERMLAQHRDYIGILESLDLQVTVLDPDEKFPDGCFVEDTAVVTPEVAVITRPGAASRRGEEAAIEPLLAGHRPIARIVAPGSVDGGDILVMGEQVLIGLSTRTNEEGARQLTGILQACGMQCISLAAGDGLHLKSSINGIGDNRLLVTQEFSECAQLSGFERVVIPADESYAGNSLWVNGRVIMPAGFPATREIMDELDIEILETQVSEFRKMDGGLTCLSIRF